MLQGVHALGRLPTLVLILPTGHAVQLGHVPLYPAAHTHELCADVLFVVPPTPHDAHEAFKLSLGLYVSTEQAVQIKMLPFNPVP